MAEEKNCQQCGAELPANAPGGVCPKCIMKLGLPTGVDPEEPAAPDGRGAVPTSATPPGGFVPPEPAELNEKLPGLEIIELLGQGGMGAVYKARQKQLDRIVALKILPPEVGKDPAFAERFTREARSLAKLNHLHIVTLYEFGQSDDNLYYFIMEFVDGTDLRHVIRAGELAAAEALAIVPQICEALQYAHEEGVVHRDIKPENILLGKRGQVKIGDFGLAKLLDRPATAYTLTQPQQRMGTPHYMAPEQIQGAHEVDHRADIYSLGVVFYEMLTGQLPIGQFAPPSQKVQVDVRLDKVVLKSLAYEPERRYQHASEVKTEVETISGVPTSTAMRKFGYEYSSKTKLFGWPMLHIATGFDPATGRKRVAKGIIALGDVAVGVVACGGVAFGGFTFGGIGIGVVAFAGVALGLLLALGGFAIGGIAFGGVAVGLIAMGDRIVGYCTYDAGKWQIGTGGTATLDPQAVAFTEFWARSGFRLFVGIFLAIPIMVLIVWLAIWIKKLVRGKTDVETISAVAEPPRSAAKVMRESSIKAAGDQTGRTSGDISGGDVRLTKADQDAIEGARQRLRIPAVGLIIVGAINCLVPAILLGLTIGGKFGSVVGFVAIGLILGAGLLIIAGASAIVRLQSYRIAVFGSIAAMFSICFPIGLPMGIWAIIVLSSAELQAAFAAKKSHLAASGKRGNPAFVLVVIGIVVIILSLLAPVALMMVISVREFDRPGPLIVRASRSDRGSNTSAQKIGDLDFPYGTWDYIEFGPAGPALTEQCAQTLDLKPSELLAVNNILQNAHREYLELEATHTTKLRTGENLEVTIAPFRDEALLFLERLWTDLDVVLDARKRAIARRHLPFGRMFGALQFGEPAATVVISKQGSMFNFEIKYQWPEGSGKNGGGGTGRAGTLPSEYQRFWDASASDK